MASTTPTNQPIDPSSGGAAAAGSPGDQTLTPLEREVLEEYARVNENLEKLTDLVTALSGNPSVEILDSLRGLERKTSLVFTLLKASVYSIVLQQQIGEEG